MEDPFDLLARKWVPRRIAVEEEEDEWAPTAEEIALAEAAEAEAPHDAYDERTASKDAEDLEAEMFQEAEYEEEDAEPQHRPKKPKLSQGHLFICSYICILDEIERVSEEAISKHAKSRSFCPFWSEKYSQKID